MALSARCRRHSARNRRRPQFAALLYGHNGFDGTGAARRRLGSPASARAALDFIADKPRGRHKLRIRCGGQPRTASDRRHRRRDPERRHAVPGRQGHGRAPGARACRALLLHPDLQDASATRPATCRRCSARATRTGATARRKATSPSTSMRFRSRRSAISARLCRQILDDVRVVVADWQPMLQQAARPPSRSSKRRRPACRPASCASRRLPAMAGGGQLHLSRVREYRLPGDAGAAS